MGPIFMFKPVYKPLLRYCILSSLLLMTGCASPLPNLHSIDFSEFNKNGEKIERSEIDKEWDRFAGVPIKLKEDQFGKMILRSSLPVLVEFVTVTWCEYCEKFKPTFGELAKGYEGKVRFATIDAELNQNLKFKMGVHAFPTFFLVKDGNVLDRWSGIGGGKNTVEKHLKSKLNIE
jgi:thioredoxin 1